MNCAMKVLFRTSMFLTVATTAFCDTKAERAAAHFDRGMTEMLANKVLEVGFDRCGQPLQAGQENARRAAADFTKAIQLKPDYAEAYYYRGVIKSEKLGEIRYNPRSAIEDLTKAIQLKPDYAEAYYCRGLIKIEKLSLYNARDAIEDFTKAIQLKPDYAEAYGARGDLREHLYDADLDGAIADYTKALELSPHAWNNYLRCEALAIAKLAKGDLDGAIADFTRELEFIEVDRSSDALAYRYRAYKSRARAKQAKGDLDGANADHAKAAQICPDCLGP
jgi:tetratricopeptide (TPR) repeat protein